MAGGNDALEFISNLTANVYIFSNKQGKLTIHYFNLKTIYLSEILMIFEFYEQKYFEKVYSKLNLAQSTKQESPKDYATNYT